MWVEEAFSFGHIYKMHEMLDLRAYDRAVGQLTAKRDAGET